MDKHLNEAIEQAKKGLRTGGIPIGSVLVYKDELVAGGHNKREQENSVIKHAEMDALENAGRRPASFYRECVLYTTLSPCPMCTGAILLYGIPKVVIGENKNFLGSEELLKRNGVEVVVLNNNECIELMEKFIRDKPELWNEDIGQP